MEIKGIGQGSNETIVNIYQMMERGDLILQPDFQRRLVWNSDHKEFFLETILKGYPFPEVYFADGEIDPETVSCKSVVVDGQQRLSTIRQYIKGDIDIKYKRIKSYKELSDDERNGFLYSHVLVRKLGHLSDDEIKEIFKRINSVSYALNAMEINNALYNGAYISTAKELSEKMGNCKFDFFKKGEYERMKDVEYVLSIMTSVELNAYFTNSKEVEPFVKRYDDSYDNKEAMYEAFDEILPLIDRMNIGWKSVWCSKSAMFSMLCELLKAKLNGIDLPKDEKVQNVIDMIDDKINSEAPEDQEYSRFYYYVCQGTASKEGRTARGDLIHKLLFE